MPFTVSRLMEFCNRRELVNQTGHDVYDWPLVVLKEATDNALDECEEAGTAPVIDIEVVGNKIIIADNGRGIPVKTIERVLDYSIRVSSREAYVSPTRGAQGNALKTILPMAYVLDEHHGEDACGETIVEAHGIAHHIKFSVDHIRQEPRIEHTTRPSSLVHGTRLSVTLPAFRSGGSNYSFIDLRKDEFIALAEAYVWLNPHASLRLTWDGDVKIDVQASNPTWSKWLPSWPTSAHWYDRSRLRRYMAAHIAHRGSVTVREFTSEFDGMRGTAKQKAVLLETGASHVSLHDFFGRGKANSENIARLLAALQSHSKPAKPAHLGVIGKAHFYRMMEAAGGNPKTFTYNRSFGETDGVPRVIEFAFGIHRDGLTAGRAPSRKVITGVNWSPGINNPFRQLGRAGVGLDAILSEVRANTSQPIIAALHLACPRVSYTDRGKSAIVVEGDARGTTMTNRNNRPRDMATDIIGLVRESTKKWTRTRKAEERTPSSRAYRMSRMTRERGISLKEAAAQIMEQAYLQVSGGGPHPLPANARQIMYAARPHIQKQTGRQLDDNYFTQTLLPDYIEENGVDWNVIYDARGHFSEPHDGETFGIGTLEVRNYLADFHHPKVTDASFSQAKVNTKGPSGNFGAVVFIEKEGFAPILEAAQIAERFDIAIMSTKGMSVTAARALADQMCADHDIPLLLLHDLDKAGFSIAGTLQRDTRRYEFRNCIKVIDLGLNLTDVEEMGLEAEYQHHPKASRSALEENLRINGASEAEIAFMFRDFDSLRSTRRVELNAMTSPQFVTFVERKLRENGVTKIVPDKDLLADVYNSIERGRRLEEGVKNLDGEIDVDDCKPPQNLESSIRKMLEKHPTMRWDAAIAHIIESQEGAE